MKELKDGWCYATYSLSKISVSLSNDQFIMKDDNFIILCACRDIKEIFISSNIRIISIHAFDNFKNLMNVEILTNSNLQTFEEYAFSFTKIKDIFFPSKVFKIVHKSFYSCKNLQIIEIAESKLESFPLSAFDKNSKFINYDSNIIKKINKFV